MSRLVVVDIGTFCDARLMDDVLSGVSKTFDLVYVVDEKRKLPKGSKSYRLKTPGMITGSSSEIDLPFFDKANDLAIWGLYNPIKALSAFTWVNTLKTLTEKAVRENNAQGLILHYGASMLIWKLDPELLNSIPVYIIYHAPGLINRTIPWIFDPIMKDPNFNLYKQGNGYKKICLESWYSYYTKIAANIIVELDYTSIKSKIAHLNHILCWDPKVTKKLEINQKEFDKVYQIGNIYNKKYFQKKWYSINRSDKKNDKLEKWIDEGPTVFMSFGTFCSNVELMKILPNLLNFLEKTGVRVLFHLTTSEFNIRESNLRKVHKGWLPYEWVVPKCSAVIFTGSVCLQSICIFNKKPMIFVPLLAEQFFWAKNYKAMTGTPYISYLDSEVDNIVDMENAHKACESSSTKKYLNCACNSMKKNNGVKKLTEIIKKSIS